jgi:signal transduction histidine kinase
MSEHEPMNILMVDNTPGKLLTYEAILSELGENLIKANSACEALTHLLHTDIPLILIDVNMPELNGFALAELIRQHPRHEHTAILFVSAVHLTHVDQLKGYEHGAVDYITAPIIPELLRAKVRVFADLHRKTVALQREIAERERLERAALRAQHFALLGRLAAGVSHEIRNPLAAAFLHLDVLEEELHQPTPERAEVEQALVEIRTNLERLNKLVEDYLTLVRTSQIELTPQDLGALLHTAVGEWRALAARHGVTLGVETLEGLGLVACHATTLCRAILNLVHNVLDAMPHGGTLTLTGQRTATQVHLHIQDTGRGIPAEQRAAIFEPLYTTKPGGTGLGLYIVQEIVQAHAGTVSVDSVAGQGTIFTLTLPCAEEAERS